MDQNRRTGPEPLEATETVPTTPSSIREYLKKSYTQPVTLGSTLEEGKVQTC